MVFPFGLPKPEADPADFYSMRNASIGGRVGALRETPNRRSAPEGHTTLFQRPPAVRDFTLI